MLVARPSRAAAQVSAAISGVVTDASGTVLDESDYYPWGGELQFTNNLDNHYKFTDKERDTETGLDYFGARYYSNGLGRFITPDWAAKPTSVPYAEFGDPQSLNLYSYVRNNPIGRVDPDGHGFDDPFGVFGSGLMTQRMLSKHAKEVGQIALTNGVGATLPDDDPLERLNSAIGKEAANELGGLFNFLNRLGGCEDCPVSETMQPKDRDEEKLMFIVGLAAFLIPESKEGWLEEQIANAERKLANISIKTLTEETLAAARREINGGMKVLKESGGVFDHVEKVQQAINGLNRQIKHLEKVLTRSGMSEAQVNRINGLLKESRDLLRTATRAITKDAI